MSRHPFGILREFYEYQYRTERDYRFHYQMKSRLAQLRDDEEALHIAEKECESLYQMLSHGHKEILSKSLEELQNSMFSGLDTETFGNTVKRILSLKVRKTE